MTTRRRALHVTIDGIPTPVLEVTTTHDVDRPIATGSLRLLAPRPAHVELGAPVEVYAGYDGSTTRIFSGRIADDEAAFSEDGGVLRVEVEGHAKALYYRQHADMSIAGPVTLQHVAYALAAERGLPSMWADETLTVNNTAVQFGGVTEVDGGAVIIQRDSSPGAEIDRMARLYGYRLFDRPDGITRLKKISGLPSETPFRDYTEGENVLRVAQSRTLDGLANYIEVIGARYQAADTSEVAVRSIPAVVPSDSRLGPDGVNRLRVSDGSILTNARADDVRNVYEVDYSAPRHRWGWTATGDPDVQPGYVVSVTSPTVGSNTAMWLMRVSHSITDRGWTTDMEGWSGAGTALPAGNDCVVHTLVGSTGFHIGNEWLYHYRTPNPAGLEKSIAFTVADDYSTLTIRGYAHGANSFLSNTQSTASRFEIWQPHEPTRAVASGEFPRQDERLWERLPYSQDQYWEPITIPLSGSMKAGSATLKIISGYDSTVGDYDDYECRDITLTTCGVGAPVIVVGG